MAEETRSGTNPVVLGGGGAAILAVGLLIGGSLDGESAADMEAKWIAEAKTVTVVDEARAKTVYRVEKEVASTTAEGKDTTITVTAEVAEGTPGAKEVQLETLLPAFAKYVGPEVGAGDSVVVIVRNAKTDTTYAILALANANGGPVVVKAQVGEQSERVKE